MRWTCVPTAPGWYWVNSGHSRHWQMAFVVSDIQAVVLADALSPEIWTLQKEVGVWRTVAGDKSFAPTEWLGPISSPSERCLANVMFSESIHHSAMDDEGAIVLAHFDLTHCKDEDARSFQTFVVVPQHIAEFIAEESRRLIRSLGTSWVEKGIDA